MNYRLAAAVCGSALMLVSASAVAADLPVKALPAALVATTWTGFYVGGNIGYGWGDARTNTGYSGSAAFDPFFIDVVSDFSVANSHTQKLTGVNGGAQFGYNYQISQKWLLGFEADFQGSAQSQRGVFVDAFGGPVCFDGVTPGTCLSFVPLNGVMSTVYQSKIAWFGTVRSRVGWLLNDQTLFYATGGLAYGRVSVSGSTAVSALVPDLNIPFGPGSGSFGGSKTKVGFTLGGGIEGAWLQPGWTWKLEYLYVDLGSLNVAATTTAAQGTLFSELLGTSSFSTHFTDNIVRVGLNYRFH